MGSMSRGEFRARQSFRGAAEEMRQTFELAPDEDLLLTGAVRLPRRGLVSRPCLLWVTSTRVCLIKHYAFRPDRAVELFRSDISGLDSRGGSLVLQTSVTGLKSLVLEPWRGSSPLGPAVQDVAEIKRALSEC